MSRIAVLDPFSGASGDMILGALIDVGVPLAVVTQAISQLGLEGVHISVSDAEMGAVRGKRVVVEPEEGQPARDWRTIRGMIDESALEPAMREAALAVFATLASAEAEAHGVDVDEVHFHEVGGVDAIADVVGACAGLHWLGVERVASHAVAVGSGWVKAEHGTLPVPAPATAILLAGGRVPLRAQPSWQEEPGELLTPTGAAILSTLAEWTAPSFTPERVGYGFGTRQLPWPNALRLWIGEVDDEPASDSDVFQLETNIDDMNPQFFEPLMERLFAAGALDVWLTAVTMKKGRPATTVSAIVPNNRRDEVVGSLILESTTLGVRIVPIERTRAPRAFRTVATRWGDVRLKLRGWNGRVIGAMPEYEDCLRLSRECGASARDVWAEANRLGEVFMGQRWEERAQGPAPA